MSFVLSCDPPICRIAFHIAWSIDTHSLDIIAHTFDMPRLAPRLLRYARQQHTILPYILYATRDIESARNELRWLVEHTQTLFAGSTKQNAVRRRQELSRLCLRRSRGVPLQYLLGTEYFGDLLLRCQPGVLIPRPETAASVTYLAERLCRGFTRLDTERLDVLDLCSGSGCIPLLLKHEIRKCGHEKVELDMLGVDISSRAIALARHNVEQQDQDARATIRFLQADVLDSSEQRSTKQVPSLGAALQTSDPSYGTARHKTFDVLISNPPYISPSAFKSTTARSVRRFEPKLALVPESGAAEMKTEVDDGTAFYPRLIFTARRVHAKIVLFEVADLQQAEQVVAMLCADDAWTGIEIWRDELHGLYVEEASCFGRQISIRGRGHGRSVVAWTAEGATWMSSDVH